MTTCWSRPENLPEVSKPPGGSLALYTIGHSAHPSERFLGLLARHGIALVADVRSHPTSRFHPQYRRRALERTLNAQGIDYVFLGDVLGGRPADPTCYRDGRLDYALVSERPWFRHGIERLLALARERTTALLCGEEDPTHCHRHLLIARYLRQEHPEVAVLHIRGDGRLERTA